MPITYEELKVSIERLRARRLEIPALRDYRPQTRSKKATPRKEVAPIELLDVFGGLIQQETNASQPIDVPTEGGELDGVVGCPERSEGGNSEGDGTKKEERLL